MDGPVLPQIAGMSGGGGGGGVGPILGVTAQQSRSRHQTTHTSSSSVRDADHAASSSSSSSSSGAMTMGGLGGGGLAGSMAMNSEEHSMAAVTSIKGLKPGNPNWTNQDNFFVCERFDNKDVHMFCVLDGHGENGHHVSKRCRENFPHHIKASASDMRRSFAVMQNDLLSCDFDVRCSGATCTLAVVSAGRLAVSNCGDSRAVLGRRNPNGSIAAHALTYDHKPDKPEERRRILACGGHLGCRQVVVNQPGKGPVNVPACGTSTAARPWAWR